MCLGASSLLYYIYIYIYTELAPKLTATACVALLVERSSKDLGLRVQFPAGGPWSCIVRNSGPGLKVLSF